MGRGWTVRPVVRVGAAVLAALVGLGVVAGVGYRVLRPQDTLTVPTVPYPEPMIIMDERPHGELRAAPLVVEGRLRVYAEKWRVWSDAPVGERYESTPYWALRRWPAQVVGVVAAETAARPIVVTQWSDGQIIALDARAGAVAWRTRVPIGQRVYDGRRTGAATVYDPRSLLTARVGGRIVLAVLGSDAVRAFDAGTGEALWQRPVACEPRSWTGSGLIVLGDCETSALDLVDALSGRERATWKSPEPTPLPAPALCPFGRTECRAVAVGGRTWLLGADARLRPVPALEPGALLAGDRLVYPTPNGVAARRVVDKTPLWSWSGRGRLIAADATGVYLLTDDRTVLGLGPADGRLAVLGCASSKPDERWRTGHVHPTGGAYLAIERITNASPDASDDEYFYGPRPVALVELYAPTKLPVWPGKFAACNPAS
jgi:outer membrane protein assembly factor BamB